MSNNSCVLIVDDELSGREILEGLLTRENLNLIFAADGFQALAQAAEHLPDLVLLDLMMPGLDGYEVCRRLRADPVLGEVPILFITTLDDQESRLKGLEAGADDFISKPFNRIELRTRVRTITRLNRQRRLMEERMKFEWVVENVDDGYVLLDEQGLIQYVNPQASVYLNTPKRHCIDQSFIDLASAHYQLEPQAEWDISWLTRLDNEQARYLLRPENSQQQALWLKADILPLPNRVQTSLLLRLQDVSEQMSLQSRIWTFQHFVSHKLRTPLNGLGALNLIDTASIENERTIKFLEMAQFSANRLETSILRILHYVEAHHLLHLQTPTAIQAIPNIVAELAKNLQINPPNINFDASLAVCLLPIPDELVELLLEELLSNAKKFHPQQQPTLDIEITLIPQTNVDMIRLSILDDGVHLPEAILSKVFIPYFQNEKGFTGEVEGMGLGLSIVNNLITSIGGHCTLKNREDREGINIILEIPLSQFSPELAKP